MKTSEVLIEARKKIEKPENWTQGAWARNVLGRKTPARDISAHRWCAVGAICAVENSNWRIEMTPGYPRAMAAMALTRAMVPRDGSSKSVVVFNDARDTKHEDVLALFDRAISAEQQKEAGAVENV